MRMDGAAQLLRWSESIDQEERDLRAWMKSDPESSRVMEYIDWAEVAPALVVPLLKAYKARHFSDDALPESMVRAMVQAMHSNPMLPALVSITPADWDTRDISMVELSIITGTLDYKYPGIQDELNGVNWESNSLSLIKAISALEVHARQREQESYESYGGWGKTRPDVGHHHVSEEVAKFVFENPDRAAEVIEVMMNRQTKDFDLITQIINSDAKALSEGTL